MCRRIFVAKYTFQEVFCCGAQTQSSMSKPAIFIVAAKRTRFGAFGGKLKNHSATDLAEIEGRGLLNAHTSAENIDHVILGKAIRSSKCALYLARHAALRLGIPQSVPAFGVNKLCGSGVQAIIEGTKQIALGESNVVLAGGAESIAKYEINRKQSDKYAHRSQTRWRPANNAGHLKKPRFGKVKETVDSRSCTNDNKILLEKLNEILDSMKSSKWETRILWALSFCIAVCGVAWVREALNILGKKPDKGGDVDETLFGGNLFNPPFCDEHKDRYRKGESRSSSTSSSSSSS